MHPQGACLFTVLFIAHMDGAILLWFVLWGRHFDLAPLGCSAPSGCRLVYCTVYRSHGWRHFVMVCIVGAAILIVFAPLGAVHPQGACLLFNVLFIAHMGAAILI